MSQADASAQNLVDEEPPAPSGAVPDSVAQVWEDIGAGAFSAAEDRLMRLMAQAAGPDAGLEGLLGYVCQQSGKYERSVQACRAAADLGMVDWSNELMLGSSLKNLGRHEEAFEALARSHRLAPASGEVAALLLEETFVTRGYDAGEALYRVLKPTIAEPAFELTWRKLYSNYIPPAAKALLEQGDIDRAEAELAAALPLGGRRVSQWLHYLDRYRRWLAFTSAQRDRADPARKPSVAVYLVTYNHERFIGAALEGILNQDFDGEVEIHVVDDASTDGTQAVVLDYQRRYPEVIKTFFNPTNIGTLDPPQQKVTYAAFQRLRSDYCCILEGDDYWSDRGKLQKQVDFLEKHPIFSCSSHNTLKVYDDGSQPAHRFLYWPGRPPVYTIDDAVSMEMFFHTSSVVYRNILMGEPPKGFASKWSCDIFNTIAHMQYGEMRYFDEDMSVYRQHVGGGYSNRSPSWGRIFNIEGLIRYNAWLGHRHLKGFAFSINRLSLSLLRESDAGTLPPLKTMQRLRYNLTAWITGAVYDLIDRYPRLDPAVLLYKEPPRSPEPRKAKLSN